jgi:hypothetical protein
METFAFLKGNYVHRKFDFADSQLSNSAIHSGQYAVANDVTVERIVIRGLTQAPSKIIKTESGLVSELTFVHHAESAQLTIRKPLAGINRDWKITLVQ